MNTVSGVEFFLKAINKYNKNLDLNSVFDFEKCEAYIFFLY